MMIMNDGLMKVLLPVASVSVRQGPDIDYGGDYWSRLLRWFYSNCVHILTHTHRSADTLHWFHYIDYWGDNWAIVRPHFITLHVHSYYHMCTQYHTPSTLHLCWTLITKAITEQSRPHYIPHYITHYITHYTIWFAQKHRVHFKCNTIIHGHTH